MYHLVGKRVRVHLYDRRGVTLGSIEGRVADFAPEVEVAAGMKKDLVYVVDIEVALLTSVIGFGRFEEVSRRFSCFS